jgi:hypothetical protein
MLAGSKNFIDKARGKRKIMGGGMRFVCHYWIREEHLPKIIAALGSIQ